jgi:hypothetical protein
MSHLQRGLIGTLAGLSVLFFTGCSSDDPVGGNGGGGGEENNSLSNPTVLETYMRTKGANVILGSIDGLQRLFVAASGGPADGVVLVPIAGGTQAIVSVDFSGDGNRESTVTGNITGDIQTGASLAITSISDPEFPSLAAAVSSTITETGPTDVVVDRFSGSVSTDEPGSGNAAETTFTGGVVAVELATGTPNGEITCDISGEGETIGITTAFEPDGQGSWRVRVTGEGIDFTVS